MVTAQGASDYIPLHFELECSPELAKTVGGDRPAVLNWLKQSLVPDLQCWELVRLRGGTYTNILVAKDLQSLNLQGQPDVIGPSETPASASSAGNKLPRLVFKIHKPTGQPGERKLFTWF